MATKVFVTPAAGPVDDHKCEATRKRVADALGICPEDVVVLVGVVGLSVVDVPHALTAAREKADKEAEKEAEKAAREEEKAAAAEAKAEAPAHAKHK